MNTELFINLFVHIITSAIVLGNIRKYSDVVSELLSGHKLGEILNSGNVGLTFVGGI